VFVSKVVGVTKRGPFFLEDPAASATYFDIEDRHYEMFVAFNKLLEKHCERNKCHSALPQAIVIFCNLFLSRTGRLTCEL
jgi:hypothetical protein